MTKRTLHQNKRLHVMLSRSGMTSSKSELVFYSTGGRTSKSSEMTIAECDQLIDHLITLPHTHPVGHGQRRKMLGLCYDLGWIDEYGNADTERLNRWLQRYGVVKKDFRAMSIKQLNKAVTQLQQMRAKTSLIVNLTP